VKYEPTQHTHAEQTVVAIASPPPYLFYIGPDHNHINTCDAKYSYQNAVSLAYLLSTCHVALHT